jgi:hypothetical protein
MIRRLVNGRDYLNGFSAVSAGGVGVLIVSSRGAGLADVAGKFNLDVALRASGICVGAAA